MKKQAIAFTLLSVALGVSACGSQGYYKGAEIGFSIAPTDAWSGESGLRQIRQEPRIVTATAPVQDPPIWRDCREPNPACTGDLKWQAE